MKPGDIVRLKGSDQLMAINYLDKQNIAGCTVVEDGKATHKTFNQNALELVSEKEIKKNRKKISRRQDAQAGSSISDKIAKWASMVTAVGFLLGSIYGGIKLSKLSDDIDAIKKKLEYNKP